MKVSLSIYPDFRANRVPFKIFPLFPLLKECFSDKYYGDELKELLIVLVIQNEEDWKSIPIKRLKPFYVDYKEKINPYTKMPIVLDKYFQFGILLNKADYEYSLICSDEECQKLCIRVIKESFHNFDRLPKKIKMFNKQKFIDDFDVFFKLS